MKASSTLINSNTKLPM